MSRKYVSIQEVARHLGVTSRTVQNYISQGYLPAYRIPGTRGVRLDLSEVERELKLVPASRARASYGSYGPKARIKTVYIPEVVSQ